MYESKMQSPEADRLFDAILSLEDREACYRFFDDLCTFNEISAMAQRLQVAQLLTEGRTFSQISSETGVSSATITRVNKCLTYGSGGYRSVLKKTAEGGRH